MSLTSLPRRIALVTAATSIATAGLLAGVTPASAIPFEGDPGPSQCLRLERLPSGTPSGSPLSTSFRDVLVLSSDC